MGVIGIGNAKLWKLISSEGFHRSATVLSFVFCLNLGERLIAAPIVLSTAANVMVEQQFKSTLPHSDPFNQIRLDVTFTDPTGHELNVPAFWAGSNVWKVRYASPLLGTHRFRSRCSEPGDEGLHGIVGTVEISANRGRNPLYVHGPLRVASGSRHLEHFDHTPFFWLGDTWWMGLCHRLHWPEEFQRLTSDRKQKGFNVVQIVAGLYPDMAPFDPRGANEAGYPWETNYTRIRPEYFDAADQRLGYLVDQGITPCIVGAWGYFAPWMGKEKLEAHWRYLIARYGAWPVVWCAAGEANLPWYLAPGFPYDDRSQVAVWTAVMRFIRTTDPFHRLLTIHPTAIKYYTARHATDDSGLLDIDMLQTPHGQRESVPVTLRAVRDSYAATPALPVINGEASYEMLSDSLPTEWTRRMFWLCVMNGAAGHTYGANGIWQCNRSDQPHGASPHGGNYGKISWDQAMQLPGSGQLGMGKTLIERYPWTRFEPHPEWVVSRTESVVSLEGCAWIWFPEGDPAKNAPTAKRYFSRSFVLPQDKPIAKASLRIAADDAFRAGLNGKALGAGGDWRNGTQFDGLQRALRPGTNRLSIMAENNPTTAPANPAGLLACLQITYLDGTSERLRTDAAWFSANVEKSGWEDANFDDGAWAAAQVIGHHGDAPWGPILPPNEASDEPQATGIPGLVRIIYAPTPQPVEIRGLETATKHNARLFDPVTGTEVALGEIQADANGVWKCPPPASQDHDWVVILESAGLKPTSGKIK